MTRTYWLSFCDTGRPVGHQFLGAVVVDVTEMDAAQTLGLTPGKAVTVEGCWIAAALRAAWKAGVNPGGEVLSARIDEKPDATLYPRLILMNLNEIAVLEQERHMIGRGYRRETETAADGTLIIVPIGSKTPDA